jgi:hypothetical protein
MELDNKDDIRNIVIQEALRLFIKQGYTKNNKKYTYDCFIIEIINTILKHSLYFICNLIFNYFNTRTT